MLVIHDLENHSRSSEMTRFDRPYHCNNNVAIFYRFRNIITFTLYVTARDLEMSFSFNTTVELTTRRVYFLNSDSRVNI